MIQALEDCHARGFLYKAAGLCNAAKRDVTLCLRAERLERSRKNREVAKAKRQQTEALWRDVDRNS